MEVGIQRNLGLIVVGLILVALCFCWAYTPQGVAIENVLLGMLVTVFASLPLLRWCKKGLGEGRIPFFEFVFFSHALFFGFAVFQGPVVFRGAEVPSKTVTYTLILVLLGMAFLWAGWRLSARFRLRLPLTYHVDEYRLIRLMMIYLTLFAGWRLAQFFGIGGAMRAVLGNLPGYMFVTTGVVAIFGLAGYEATGNLSLRQRCYFWAVVAVLLSTGLASGWLEQALLPLVAAFLGRLVKGGRFSWALLAAVLGSVLFFQIGKQKLRSEFWAGCMGGPAARSVADLPLRVSFWVTGSRAAWSDIGEQGQVGQRVLSTFKRFDHLTWFAWVVHMTPSQIPFLKGRSYRELHLYLIPRLLWRGKPINLEEAYFIALRYGWLSSSQVGRTAVSPGLMDEAYINFGVAGIVLGMGVLGLFIGVFVRMLDDRTRGLGWQLPLIALLCLKWEPLATAAGYFGGFFQPLLIVLLMYLPARCRRSFRVPTTLAVPKESMGQDGL